MALADKYYIAELADGNPAIVQDEYAVAYVRENKAKQSEVVKKFIKRADKMLDVQADHDGSYRNLDDIIMNLTRDEVFEIRKALTQGDGG